MEHPRRQRNGSGHDKRRHRHKHRPRSPRSGCISSLLIDTRFHEVPSPLEDGHRLRHAPQLLRDRDSDSRDLPQRLHGRHIGSHEGSPFRDQHRNRRFSPPPPCDPFGGLHISAPRHRDRPRPSPPRDSYRDDFPAFRDLGTQILSQRHRGRHIVGQVSPSPARDHQSSSHEALLTLHERFRKNVSSPRRHDRHRIGHVSPSPPRDLLRSIHIPSPRGRARHRSDHDSSPPPRDRQSSTPPLRDSSPPFCSRYQSSRETNLRQGLEDRPRFLGRYKAGHVSPRDESPPSCRDQLVSPLRRHDRLRTLHVSSSPPRGRRIDTSPPLQFRRSNSHEAPMSLHRSLSSDSEASPSFPKRDSATHKAPEPVHRLPGTSRDPSPSPQRRSRSREIAMALHRRRSSGHEGSPPTSYRKHCSLKEQGDQPRKNQEKSPLTQDLSVGSQEPSPTPPKQNPFEGKNFKLVVDPILVKGKKKLYRVNGVVPFGSTSWNISHVTDPRPSLMRKWPQLDALDLPIPRFLFDKHSVGERPALEVTVINLNDNIDRQFLKDMALKYGEVKDSMIFYHPVTQKHLGIAKLVFLEVEGAAACVSGLNLRSVMGKQLNVFLDPLGRKCQKLFEDLTTVKNSQSVIENESSSPEQPCLKEATKMELDSDDEKKSHNLQKSPNVETEPVKNEKEDFRKEDPPSTSDGQLLDVEPLPFVPPEFSNALGPPCSMVPPFASFSHSTGTSNELLYPPRFVGCALSQKILPSPLHHLGPRPLNDFPPQAMLPPTIHHLGPHPPYPSLHQPILPPVYHGLGPRLPSHSSFPPPPFSHPGPPSETQAFLPPSLHHLGPHPPSHCLPQTNLPPTLHHLGLRPPGHFGPQTILPPTFHHREPRPSDNSPRAIPPPPPHRRKPRPPSHRRHPVPPSDPPVQRLSPPVRVPPPEKPLSPPSDGPLNLDARIELLLKIGATKQDDEPPPIPKVTSAPPLPAGDSKPPSPTPSEQSAYSPLNSPFTGTSPSKYEPLSPTPSPFMYEEEYRECLLDWKLKHLAIAAQRESDSLADVKPHGAEIVSDKKGTDLVLMDRPETMDKDIPLSNGDLTVQNMESVYKFRHDVAEIAQNSMHERHFNTFVPPPAQYHNPCGSYPTSRPGFHPFNLFNPFQPAPTLKDWKEVPCDKDPAAVATDIALERIKSMLQATLEKDLVKRMTEALAFHELENWWTAEAKKYKAEFMEKDKEVLEEKEERNWTAESILNAAADSYDGNYVALGLRASLPKMPSFRRKTPTVEDYQEEASNKMNESDEEEMVQQSDSEGEDTEPESMMTKKRSQQEESEKSEESSSDSDDSGSSSDTEDSSSGSEDSDSSSEHSPSAKECFLASVDSELLEKMREKTPEGRLTPIPMDVFCDSDSENIAPSTPDSHKSCQKQEELLKTPSPNGPRQSAMAALSALGLDEFISDVIIREDDPKASKPEIKTPSPTLPLSSNRQRKDEYCKKEYRNEADITKDTKDSTLKDLLKPETLPQGKENCSAGDDLNSVPYSTLKHSYQKPNEPEKDCPSSWVLDHDYCEPAPKETKKVVKSSPKEKKKLEPRPQTLKKTPGVSKVYSPRDTLREMLICYDFLTEGIDQEDAMYLKNMYDGLLSDESQSYWMSDMHWVSHPLTASLTSTGRRHRSHATGCARTEGYYKMSPMEKQKHRHHYNKNKMAAGFRGIQTVSEPKTNAAAVREARSNQRRLLTAFGDVNDSDLLKFNQLKFRKKQLKFSKSEIHDWGLFAVEPIAADEMVIEYAGQMIRPFLADHREKSYEKSGIGSSYLFRIDAETIIDATHCGNLSRFINHSCNPNCYAKIITIEGEKKIVIYSKRDIQVDEEITYDYKFPLEEEKIKCLCNGPQCKGFLN